uniref:Uncharacterized protein n=1 Tax=Arundo donax TaxID=35708 RepID=A0A0A9HMP5_ARUDO
MLVIFCNIQQKHTNSMLTLFIKQGGYPYNINKMLVIFCHSKNGYYCLDLPIGSNRLK